jgi:hypothetical protein
MLWRQTDVHGRKWLQVVPEDGVLIRRVVTGVNASDVNFSSGKYQGSPAAAKAQMPFTAGFESVGVVCKAGASSGAAFRAHICIIHQDIHEVCAQRNMCVHVYVRMFVCAFVHYACILMVTYGLSSQQTLFCS